MAKVLVPLAPGFEDLEAITIIDLLRRANIEVVTAGLDDQPVVASRQSKIIPDSTLEAEKDSQFDLIVLPGGLPGADNLRDDPLLTKLLQNQNKSEKLIAAICAAPKVLANAGVITNRKITCYPGALAEIEQPDFDISSAAIEEDNNIITSRSAGTAMTFALKLIERLAGHEQMQTVKDSLEMD